jgi:membrane-associated protease RseP (regulator of RpoE activity)
MSSPKHLWSGDWERESPELKAPPAPRVDAFPITPPDPKPWPPRTPATGSRRFTVTVVAAIVVVLVAVGVTLAATLGGSSTRRTSAQNLSQNPFSQSGSGGAPLLQQSPSTPTTTTPQATTPQGTTTPQSAAPESQPGGASVTAGPTYTWLGMSIADIASGVSVETVNIGGAADAAGVNPGDVIVEINQTEVDSVSQVLAALKHLKLGQSFRLTVDRGSTPVQLIATLTGRPVHS